jgi:hypothetical protein
MNDRYKAIELGYICDYIIDLKDILRERLHLITGLFATVNNDCDDITKIKYKEYADILENNANSFKIFFDKINLEDNKTCKQHKKLMKKYRADKIHKILGEKSKSFEKPITRKKLLIKYYANVLKQEDYVIKKLFEQYIIFHDIIQKYNYEYPYENNILSDSQNIKEKAEIYDLITKKYENSKQSDNSDEEKSETSDDE